MQVVQAPRARRRIRPALRFALPACLVLSGAVADGADDLVESYARQIRPLLVNACGDCHGKQPRDNDLDLTGFGTAQAILASPKVLGDVAERVRAGDMPPKDAPQPNPAERKMLLDWIGSALDAEAAARAVLRWAVAKSPNLPEDVRTRCVARFGSRLTHDGELVLHGQRYRDQPRNVADCLERIRAMLSEVAVAPRKRRPTKPSRGSIERRLHEKSTSQRKQGRRPPRGSGEE